MPSNVQEWLRAQWLTPRRSALLLAAFVLAATLVRVRRAPTRTAAPPACFATVPHAYPLVIGLGPWKTGTTSLWAQLRAHACLCAPRRKRHFWHDALHRHPSTVSLADYVLRDLPLHAATTPRAGGTPTDHMPTACHWLTFLRGGRRLLCGI